MGLISLLLSDPLMFIALAFPLLYSIIAHEVAHGWVASLFGDDTARVSGRLSLSPLPHLDPLGTLALFIVGFGWAKPVPVNYYMLRPRRAGIICVSLAGCLTNILIASAAIFLLGIPLIAADRPIALMLVIVARINILLGAFNLIPIPPLDGSRILAELLPVEGRRLMDAIEPYGLLVLMLLLFTGTLDPVITGMQNLIIGIIRTIL